MIDIHSHIIPKIDDGSKSVESSFEIFKEASKVGFTDIILTPHYINDFNENSKHIREYWVTSLNDALKELKIPIKVYVGNEIYVCENIDELIYYKKASTLNNSMYVLFELPMNDNIMYLDQVIFKIFNLDMIPVLAHPERYSYIQKDIGYAEKLHEKGVLFQSNYGSFVDIYGKQIKKTVIKLLKNNLIDFLGSDVHRPNTIYPVVEESLTIIEEIAGKQKLNELTITNPQKIILNEPM